MTWRTLPFEVDEAARLVDRARLLLDGLADDPVPTLRWYRAVTPALVLGRGQSLPETVPEGLPVVGRWSGGGAVLLDEDVLSLDVLLPAGHNWLSDDVGAVFGRVGEAWASALEKLGVDDVAVHHGPAPSRRGSPRQRLLAAVCYATLGRGEVTAGGRKIVGLAQRRRRPGVLVQCGLLRRWRPSPLLVALGAAPEDPEILAAAVGLDDLVDPPPPDDVVMASVTTALEG